MKSRHRKNRWHAYNLDLIDFAGLGCLYTCLCMFASKCGGGQTNIYLFMTCMCWWSIHISLYRKALGTTGLLLRYGLSSYVANSLDDIVLIWTTKWTWAIHFVFSPFLYLHPISKSTIFVVLFTYHQFLPYRITNLLVSNTYCEMNGKSIMS